MEYRTLSGTDIVVSTVAMGGWAIADDSNWGVQDEAVSAAAIKAALDAGITFFDTAEGYGNGRSEVVLGKALAGLRRSLVIASKVSDKNLALADIAAACEGSLGRLGTDYLDLYQIHYANPGIPLAETMGALDRLRQEGKVRAVGVCNFGVHDMADALKFGGCTTNQLPYSLLWRAIEFEVLPYCADHGIGVLAYSPLCQGLLTGKFTSADQVPEGRARTRHFSHRRPKTRHGEPGCEVETFSTIERLRDISQRMGRPLSDVAIAWVRQHPAVGSVIVGARTSQQLRENLRALEFDLSPEVLAELNDATDALKQQLGPNPDMWQSVSRFR
jgi:aryl-alcohol dehydrogenase-like predicted oxidoreductase